MILRLINLLARLCRRRVIGNADGDYLHRFAARWMGWLPGDKPRNVSAYLHHFLRPDGDRELHNHPWTWAFSIVLWGGYTEERFCPSEAEFVQVPSPFRHRQYGCRVCGYISMSQFEGKHKTRRRLRFLSFNFIRGTDYHRVSELHGKETWTLFIAGPKASSWGFFVPGEGHVEWREFLQRKGIPIDY